MQKSVRMPPELWKAFLPAAVLLVPGSLSQAAGKSATFVATAVRTGSSGTVTIRSRCWITETRARADVDHPLEGKATVIITGTHLYQLDPAGKKGVRLALPPRPQEHRDHFQELVAKLAFDASSAIEKGRKVRIETVSGYSCDVIEASATKGDARRTMTVWLPRKMQPRFPVKAVMKETLRRPGVSLEQTTTITLSQVRLNVPIADAVFAVPAGYVVKEVKSGEATPGGNSSGGN